MNVRSWIVIAAILAATSPLLGPSPARAAAPSLSLCNKTAEKIRVAVGYFTSGVTDTANKEILTGPFVSNGYYYLEVGNCRTFDNPSNARYVFWFASGNALNANPITVGLMHSNGNDWKYNFCVRNYFVANEQEMVPPFIYEDENASEAACDQAGGTLPGAAGHTLWVTANKVDLLVNGEVDFTGCKLDECAEFWNDKTP